MDEDSKFEEMMDSCTIIGNKEICVKLDHDYCAAFREEKSVKKEHFMKVDEIVSSAAVDMCDHIVVNPVGAYSISEVLNSPGSVGSKSRNTESSCVVPNMQENLAIQEKLGLHQWCKANKISTTVGVDVDECDHIVVSPVGTFSRTEGDGGSECAKLDVGNASAFKDVYGEAVEAEWDGSSPYLRVGLTFQTRAQVRKFLAIYGNKSLCKMVVAAGGASDTSKSRQVSILVGSKLD